MAMLYIPSGLNKVDKERYSTPELGGKMRGGGIFLKDDVTNIFRLHCFNGSIYKKLDLIDYKLNIKNSLK